MFNTPLQPPSIPQSESMDIVRTVMSGIKLISSFSEAKWEMCHELLQLVPRCHERALAEVCALLNAIQFLFFQSSLLWERCQQTLNRSRRLKMNPKRAKHRKAPVLLFLMDFGALN